MHPLSVSTQFALALPAKNSRIDQIIDSLEQARTVLETEISPNGKVIAWNVDGRDGGIEFASLSNPLERQYVTACVHGTRGDEHGLAWSPDSMNLAFFSNCTPDHKTAIFLVDPASNAAPRLVTSLGGFASALQWSPDGRLLTFLYVESTTHPSGVIFAITPRSGVIGDGEAKIQRIAVVDPARGDIRQLSPANLHVFEYGWSPDSAKLAYIAATPPGENNWWFSELYT